MKKIVLSSAIAIALLGGGVASAKESAEGGADSRFVTATSAISEEALSEVLKLAFQDELFVKHLREAELLGWKPEISAGSGEVVSLSDGSRGMKIVVPLTKADTAKSVDLMFAVDQGESLVSYLPRSGWESSFDEFERERLGLVRRLS